MKNRLYEIMGKVNPDFKKINENLPPDVQSMERSMQDSPGVTQAKERINQPNEFEPAFEVWFNTLGFDPNEAPITKAAVRSAVDSVLTKLGYS